MELFRVGVFGHIRISDHKSVEDCVEKEVRKILSIKGTVEFLVGREGDFNQIVSSTVKRVQKTVLGSKIRLMCILPFERAFYGDDIKKLEKYYDSVCVWYKFFEGCPDESIVFCNREIVDCSDLIVCFFEHDQDGVCKIINYAEEQGKPIINIALKKHKL